MQSDDREGNAALQDGAGGTAAAAAPPLWALADYRRLATVGLLVAVVRWLETLAAALFVLASTHSAFLVALLTMLRLLPMGLFGVLIGALADRVERTACLAAIMAASAAASAAVALLAWWDVLAVWHLAAAAFLNGLSWAADNPIRRMLVGQVVGPARMGVAMSVDVGANNLSRLLGPTLGGAVFALSGIAGAFALGAVLHAAGLLACLRLAVRSGTVPRAAAQGVLARISEGFVLALRDRRLRGTLWVTIIFNVWGWPFTALVPVVARESLALSEAATGLLTGMDGLGALASAVALGLLARPAHYAACYVGGVALYLLGILLFALAPGPLLAGAALAVNGLGHSGFSIMQATLVYLAAPADLRARVLGVLTLCIGLGPVGFLHVGLLAEAFGARAACLITAGQGLAALALTWRWWRPVLRES